MVEVTDGELPAYQKTYRPEVSLRAARLCLYPYPTASSPACTFPCDQVITGEKEIPEQLGHGSCQLPQR